MGHYDKFEEKKLQEQRDRDNNRMTVDRDGVLITNKNISDKLTQEDKDWIGFLLDEALLTEGLDDMDDMFKELLAERAIDHSLREPEFDDIYKVLEMGAKKHGAKNWLEPNGSKSSHKDMHASMFRHLAESSVGKTKDDESGLHPLLHLATRALMVYTRQQRGITHEEDLLL